MQRLSKFIKKITSKTTQSDDSALGLFVSRRLKSRLARSPEWLQGNLSRNLRDLGSLPESWVFLHKIAVDLTIFARAFWIQPKKKEQGTSKHVTKFGQKKNDSLSKKSHEAQKATTHLHVPSCLTHHPNRSVFDLFSSSSAEKQRILHLQASQRWLCPSVCPI